MHRWMWWPHSSTCDVGQSWCTKGAVSHLHFYTSWWKEPSSQAGISRKRLSLPVQLCWDWGRHRSCLLWCSSTGRGDGNPVRRMPSENHQADSGGQGNISAVDVVSDRVQWNHSHLRWLKYLWKMSRRRVTGGNGHTLARRWIAWSNRCLPPPVFITPWLLVRNEVEEETAVEWIRMLLNFHYMSLQLKNEAF